MDTDRRLRASATGQDGLSFVEVLIVLLIIGVLAAIALPAFHGHEERGQDASAKSDARNAVSQVESCFAEEEDYARCEKRNARNVDAALADARLPVTVTAKAGTRTTAYIVQADSASGNRFRISLTTDGTYSRECDTKGEGACPSTGIW
jgi:type IV pilus assembly protein PilA